LLAAFATLCERPAFILNCFLTRSFSFRGKYQVRLFDQKKGCFVTITIDDYIPCNKRTGMVRKIIASRFWVHDSCCSFASS